MITCQPSMSTKQSGIGLNPMANPRSVFVPSSGSLVGSTIMSTTSYTFGWNWNRGVSAQTESVTPMSVLPYPREINGSVNIPFLGGTNILGIYPFLGGVHVSSRQPFPRNVNIPTSYYFPGGTYPPSNVWQQGENYFPMGQSYQGG